MAGSFDLFRRTSGDITRGVPCKSLGTLSRKVAKQKQEDKKEQYLIKVCLSCKMSRCQGTCQNIRDAAKAFNKQHT
jgi:hypothetical protein